MSSLKLVKPGCFGFGTNAHTHTHAYIQAQTCMLYPYTHELLYAFMSCKRCTRIFVLFFGDFLFWRPPCFVCQVCVGEVEGWRCCGSGVQPLCVGLCTSEKTALKKTTNTLQIKVWVVCVYIKVCVCPLASASPLSLTWFHFHMLVSDGVCVFMWWSESEIKHSLEKYSTRAEQKKTCCRFI